MFDKIVALFRSSSTPPGAAGINLTGVPMMGACDSGGILWTRPSTGAGGSSISGGTIASDNLPTTQVGQDSRSFIYGFDGATWDRIRTLADNGDAQALLTLGLLATIARLQGFNGATYDRLRTISSLLANAQPKVGVLSFEKSGHWSVFSFPAVGTAASITRSAGGAGIRHICTSIAADMNGTGASGQVVLRDGATGVGPILFSLQCTNANQAIRFSDLAITGSENTAMTLEFTGAVVGVQQNVNLTGYDA